MSNEHEPKERPLSPEEEAEAQAMQTVLADWIAEMRVGSSENTALLFARELSALEFGFKAGIRFGLSLQAPAPTDVLAQAREALVEAAMMAHRLRHGKAGDDWADYRRCDDVLCRKHAAALARIEEVMGT